MQPEPQVVTGEAVALDLRLAGAGSRGVAAGIDLTIEYILVVIALIAISVAGSSLNNDLLAVLGLLAYVGILLGYPVMFETLWHGKTPGKAMMGLRVVRDDGGRIRFRHAFVRGLTGVFIEKLGFTLGLAAFFPIVIGSHKKRIGDLLCGTLVLQERVPGSLDAPIWMPPALAGWAASLDLSAIDDAFALRLRQFVGRAAALTPQARVTLENQLAVEVVARVGPPPPGTPSWALLTAVLAERRERALRAASPPHTPPLPAPLAATPSPVATPPPTTLPPTAAPPTATPPTAAQPPAPSTTGYLPPT